jgi:hypothetical protein
VIASDASDGKLECGDIGKNFAAIVAQVAIFVVGKLAFWRAVKILTTSFGRRGTAERSTTLWTRAKIAEFTPIARARVNTAIVVNPGALRSCRRANLKSWIIEKSVSREMRVAAGLDSKN